LKKVICIVVALLVLSLGSVMASPLNDLWRGQTAIGVANDNIYIEHKIVERFTIGLQNIDVSSNDSTIDFYGQYHFTGNFRGIIGQRDFLDNSVYAGVGVTGKLDNKWNGHAYVIFSNEFTEAQVGAAYKLAYNLDGNVYFRSFMPDVGKDKNRLSVGLTYKF